MKGSGCKGSGLLCWWYEWVRPCPGGPESVVSAALSISGNIMLRHPTEKLATLHLRNHP